MKRLLIFLGITCVLSVHAERLNFSSDWKFSLNDPAGAKRADFDDSGWRTLDVPHDWSVEFAFSQENPGRNAWLPGGIAWYRKTVDVPAEDAGKVFEIQFDGVYRHAEVYVNGAFVGRQFDGYTSFYFDITEFVRPGQENVVAVRVDNHDVPNCRWYSGSGIYRQVWLTKKTPVHVKNWGTYITTPEITDRSAEVSVKTELANKGRAETFELETVVFDPAGREVARAVSSGKITSEFEAKQSLTVENPQRWSVDSPLLYSTESRVKVGGKTVDVYRSTFGIRSFRFDGKKGFFLNGKNMKLKGVCLHHDMGTVGAAVPLEMWERRLRNLKALGCNAIRTAHNPMAPEFMDLCDRMGFLVMDEFVDKWEHHIRPNADPLNDPKFAEPNFRKEWKKNFEQTIRRDRNHPSVIIWSVGNENYPAGSEKQNQGLKEYCNFVRTIDPTRPVVSGMERGLDKDPSEKVDDILESTQYMDLIGMNYGEQWVKRIGHRNPGKAFVSTESYVYYNSTEFKRWDLVERSPWFDVLENEFNAGLFLWSGTRYLGEVSKSKDWPRINGGSSALLDMASFKTVNGYFYEALWSDRPTVSIAVYDEMKPIESFRCWGSPARRMIWNFKNGESLNLVTFTNCEFVELYLNGRKIGKQKLSDFSNRIMNWYDIEFEPGELKAVGINNGKPVCEFSLQTAGEPARIKATADRETIRPGGVVQVEVQLTDEAGVPVKHDDRLLSFSVRGGEVLGLDFGTMGAEDHFTEKKHRRTDEGRCLAIVKGGSAEAVQIRIESKGLAPVELQIPVERKVVEKCR
ncbi:glycoside hydrolase family 2 TIM barrel-domain containing protein [Pontiella agarivorans]|uniref:Glycoside hydrolase family 2 TIM barrel-domain containing protein n=1 Tax=Pontiella agarivorans TaxID=3038953 RepID=A0ABU5N285_9BACT|nr:glycoside hydrolase family 2 TIM barrel-domain containing protein [Pontiella agarivorans]MDZ8120544.1 glycoside hydrolase family 2 TIM barrel-domain containing protein [Pontiella agarivorans]